MITSKIPISACTHPCYDSDLADWVKWRNAYNGGRYFVDKYLRKFSQREDELDFQQRKAITYCPRFAGAGIDEIKNSIYQRMADIIRTDGSRAYQEAVEGKTKGVDLHGNSMNSFIGQEVLPELLLMGITGVFVDMPQLKGPSQFDSKDARPYLYLYKAEDIRNWIPCSDDPTNYEMLLLRNYAYSYDAESGFPIGTVEQFRKLWRENGRVYAQITDDEGNKGDVIELGISRIPFVRFEISNSLMEDIADIQIALMNIASSDLAFINKANFPFYTEQFDARMENSPYIRREGTPQFDSEGNPLPEGTSEEAKTGSDNDIKVGTSAGRRYPIGTERPAFINPSKEPMEASMEKQRQLKEEIRLLLNLSLSNVKTVGMASAESKKEDNRSLESGLSNIGLTLEKGERQIAQIWAEYEGSKNVTTVKYPVNYSLRSEEERRLEAKDLEDRMMAIPSATYQKEVGKSIARIMLGHRISTETLSAIDKEIDATTNMVSKPDIVAQDVENGLVSPETASKLRGYPDGEAAKAEEAHARRLDRLAKAQSKDMGARGIPDLSPDPAKAGSEEKKQSRDTTTSDRTGDRTRGKGR